MLLLALKDGTDINNPQIFTDTSSIGIAEYVPELIHTDEGDFLRHFLISDVHSNTNGWKVENLQKYLNTFIGKPLIISPGYHHIGDTTIDGWLQMQAPYAVGSMEQILFNPKYKSYDAMTRITNPNALDAMKKGFVPRFVSPAIFGTKFRYDTIDGKKIKVFEEWEGMQSAVVKRPSFRPMEMATIQDTACTGNKFLCRKELENIAIAEDLDIAKLLENNFTSLNNTNEKKPLDKNMAGNDDGSNASTVLIEKLQKELLEANKARDLESEKNKTLAESFKKEQERNAIIAKEKEELKTKYDAIEAEKTKAELKKALNEKLSKTKLFFSDADGRNKKVDELVEKNFKPEDLDIVYENQFMTEDEIKEAQEKLNSDPKAGIAEDKSFTGLQTKNANERHAKGAKIMETILNLRTF